MKPFLIKLPIFLLLFVVFLTALLNFYGRYADPFYEKFTTPKQYSMILGASRALRGIRPQVLDSSLSKNNYALPTYNFSFTIKQASYGKSYLQAVKRKLDSSVTNQLFIVTVNPWMLANRTPNARVESDSILLEDPPHNMLNMTATPNFEYLIKNFRFFNFRHIFRKENKLHKDGWLEPNLRPYTSEQFLERKQSNVSLYINMAKDSRISKYRLYWLQNTILYLKRYGRVVVVRMPVDKEFLVVENKFWKNFDSEMENITASESIDYFNFSVNKWSTYDGQHLDKNGSKLFSRALSDSIKNE